MLGGLRLVSVQKGYDPRDFALIAFGGAGPLHANALGRLTGAWPVIIPPSPGVLCALGDATTSARDEAARTLLRRFHDLDAGELRDILTGLSDQAGERLERAGHRPRRAVDHLPHRRALLRPGQRHRRRGAGRRARRRRHPRRAGASASTPSTSGCSPSPSTSTTSWSTPARRSPGRARTSPRPRWTTATATRRRRAPAPPGSTSTASSSTPASTTASELRAGDVVPGPAIVVEMDSTTLVLPGHHATAHRSGSLLIEPVPATTGQEV